MLKFQLTTFKISATYFWKQYWYSSSVYIYLVYIYVGRFKKARYAVKLSWVSGILLLQYFFVDFLSEILNCSSCPKCRRLVALDPVNEEDRDTRSLFEGKLFCVQNVHRGKLGRVRLSELWHYPVCESPDVQGTVIFCR